MATYTVMKIQKNAEPVNRRDFLRGSSLASLMAMMGAVEIRAEDQKPDPGAEPKKLVGPPVNCAVIGSGFQGREILASLGRLPNAPVIGVCDKYKPSLNRGLKIATKAEGFEEYRKALDSKDVQAVIVATPTHQHREIVEAALSAGKHVYCEAPIAHTIEDARAIAKAARAAIKQNFQAGLQLRSDAQRHYILAQFVRNGATGKFIKARSQWNKKATWRTQAANAEREKEVNWRLSSETASGLVGEIGIHQIDAITWFFNERPSAVSGSGSLMLHRDGREVPDTVEVVVEYPSGALLTFGSTLASSFDSQHDVIHGSDSSILMRGIKGWLFKEVDSPLLGWEVYAKKELVNRETGIVLRADATKLQARDGAEEGADEVISPTQTPLHFSLEAFIENCSIVAAGVDDFTSSYGEKAAGLKDYMAGLEKSKFPSAGYKEGFEAAVTVIKANEAILGRKRIALQEEWFQI
jgi:predicted dehydrogenase